jgi:DNA-binding response OmpR family regulator
MSDDKKELLEGIKYSLQDDDRTLKVFIDKLRWKEDL